MKFESITEKLLEGVLWPFRIGLDSTHRGRLQTDLLAPILHEKRELESRASSSAPGDEHRLKALAGEENHFRALSNKDAEKALGQRLLAEVERELLAAHTSQQFKSERDSWEYALEVTSFVEAKLQYETGWIGQRMSWLVISQSFLFGAFVASANSALGNMVRPMGRHVMSIVMCMLPVLGFVQSLAAYASILAAQSVDYELTKFRGAMHDYVKKHVPGMGLFPSLGLHRKGNAATSHQRGSWAAHVICRSLIFAWIVVLVVCGGELIVS
jgi:hypothetical protein